ncbi:39S ribosomal protein L1, mitochondrial-like [Varroa destructor]|uniref:Mitochondrial ribosomal protein L1 n=1 Tax=Varroa destructor TaxID=109461 RepID=A0A7M7K465_VARDE|nr:39S ribosomal protein L1, mitochondrial-like [Varroa destructor]
MSICMMRGFWRSLGPHKVPLFSSAFGMQDRLKLPYEQNRGYPTQKHQKLILAAQKRNRARKLQKLEETEVDFVTSQKSAALRKTVLKSKRYDPGNNLPSELQEDVYFRSWYREKTYSLEECIQMHRELMHPSMFDRSDNILIATVELNMQAKKKNKYLDRFEGTLLYPHVFPNKSRITKILCFCRSSDDAVKLMDNGADLAGGTALVKKITAGEIDHTLYDHILSSVDMMEELLPLRNILKKKMPTPQKTMTSDPFTLVKLFRKSVVYEARKDPYEPDYAQFSVPLARLDMPLDQIKANLKFLFTEVNEHMPSGRPINSFITQVFISSPPSPERFVLNRDPYEKYIAETTVVAELAGRNKLDKQKKAIVIQRDETQDADDEKEAKEGNEDANKTFQTT